MSERSSLSVLKRHIERTRVKTDDAREKKMERRVKNKEKRAKAKIPNFELEAEECGQNTSNKVTWMNVRGWFMDGIEKRISWSVTVPPSQSYWKPKSMSLARKLLDMYGDELVEKAVNYFCDNWEQMVDDSGGTLSGLPTIELLFSIRDRIFPQAERGAEYVSRKWGGKKGRDYSEYVEPEDSAKTDGWD